MLEEREKEKDAKIRKKHKEMYENQWIGSQAYDIVAMSKVVDRAGVLLVF